MALRLTPDILRAAYEFLSETAPFRNWNLPQGEDIKFSVAKDRTVYGWHILDGGTHKISVSNNTVGHTETLIQVMAHEMIHVHESNIGACASGEHSRAFHRWADQVCKHHGFDPKNF